jgi:hypothetical protein
MIKTAAWLRRPESIFFVVVAFYLALACLLSNAPLQDMPNHLTRGHIIADLWFNHGLRYGQLFTFKPMMTPYLFGDLLVAGLEESVGTAWTSRLWIAACIVLLPLGAWFALRAQQVSHLGAITGAILALYLSTNWFFVMGFMNYQLATGCAFFAYGWFLRARRSGRTGDFVRYVVLLAVGYALHLSALIFVGALVGVSLALALCRREISPWRAAGFLLPACLLLAVHLALGGGGGFENDPAKWGTFGMKLLRLASPIIRFDRTRDLLLFGFFLLAMFVPIAMQIRLRFAALVDPLVLTGVFLGLYFIMPRDIHGLYDIDDRALPYAFVFLMFSAVLASESSGGWGRALCACAVLLAGVNLAYLMLEMLPQDAAMGRYKQLASGIPAGSHVLPINTRHIIGRYQPFLHAGSYATMESGAVTPYLFAGNSTPAEPYFLYVDLPYDPANQWYTDGRDDQADWTRIRADYSYLLVTKPWDPAKIPLHFRVVKSNDVAALLDIR